MQFRGRTISEKALVMLECDDALGYGIVPLEPASSVLGAAGSSMPGTALLRPRSKPASLAFGWPRTVALIRDDEPEDLRERCLRVEPHHNEDTPRCVARSAQERPSAVRSGP
jgi:hypothetical protein